MTIRKLNRIWEAYHRAVARAAFARDGLGSASRLERAREEAAELAARINDAERELGRPVTAFEPIRGYDR